MKNEHYNGLQTRRELHIEWFNAERGYRTIAVSSSVLDTGPFTAATRPSASIKAAMQEVAGQIDGAMVGGGDTSASITVRVQDIEETLRLLQPALDEYRSWANTTDPSRLAYLESVGRSGNGQS